MVSEDVLKLIENDPAVFKLFDDWLRDNTILKKIIFHLEVPPPSLRTLINRWILAHRLGMDGLSHDVMGAIERLYLCFEDWPSADDFDYAYRNITGPGTTGPNNLMYTFKHFVAIARLVTTGRKFRDLIASELLREADEFFHEEKELLATLTPNITDGLREAEAAVKAIMKRMSDTSASP